MAQPFRFQFDGLKMTTSIHHSDFPHRIDKVHEKWLLVIAYIIMFTLRSAAFCLC